jgi:hypothetical protein
MTSRSHRIVFWAGVVALGLAHMWPRLLPAEGPTKLWFGWLPGDMAYHLLWIVAAAAWVIYMTGPVWSAEEVDDV